MKISTTTLTKIYQQLADFGSLEAFSEQLPIAFGTQYDPNWVEVLRFQWQNGNFSQLPQIEEVSSEILGSANGAFSASTNTIYLSESFLATASADGLNSVLLEEIGHWIDSKINQLDTPGDEGAIFSALVRGENFNQQQLSLLQAEDDSGVITLDGHTIVIEQAGVYTGTNIDSVINGMDQFLDNLQSAVNSQIFRTKLPLIGDRLKDTSKFIDDFRDDIKSNLQNQLATPNDTAEQVKTALFNALKPLNLLKDANGNGSIDINDITVVQNADNVTFSLKLNQASTLLNTPTPLSFKDDLPGLNLDVTGNVKTQLGFDLNLNFGINKTTGFYVDTKAPDEFKINLDTSINLTKAEGQLGFLKVEVEDDTANPTKFQGGFVVDLKGQGDKLTNSEFSSMNLAAALSGSADINLKTKTTFNGSTVLPSLKSDVNVDWKFNSSDNSSGTFGQAPTVAFNNVSWDLVSFFDKFAGPILKNIKTITEPVQPVIEVLTKEIDLGVVKFDLLDIGESLGYIDDEDDKKFIESAAKLITLVNSIPDNAEGTSINMGNFNLGSLDLSNGNEESLSNAEVANITPTTAPANNEFIKGVEKVDGLTFPILTDPMVAFNLLLGKSTPVTLFAYDMPALDFNFPMEQFFPIGDKLSL
jgi:hypothetical protein